MFEEFEFANDTDQEAERKKFEILARMTPQERMSRFLQLNVGVRKLAVAGILHRHPFCSPEDLKKRKAALFFG